jgi:hypothetical protein
LSADITRVVEAWFMNSWGEPNFSENFVCVFLPESWGFWMALHGRKNWNDMTGWNWWQMYMLDPPFIESTIWENEKSLFWRWGFSKRVGDASAIHK